MGFQYGVELRTLYARLVVLAFAFHCGSNLGIGLPGKLTDTTNSTSVKAGFVIEPNDAFVFKNFPATMTCAARLVSKLEFNCSGGVSPNNVRYKQNAVDVITLSTRIYRYMIKSLRQILCFCVATTPSGAILKSRMANFTLASAYLKDNITISSPSGTRVHKSGTISLLCQPPKGFPEPTVTWMKDGIAVTTSDDGRVQINEDANSSMIVIQVAILSDSASYQCVAINVAGMKESATIPVTVFVDGGWSGWSEFSKCDAKCGNGTKMLKRSCTNPSPENGGQLCQGRRIKVVPCQDICQDIEIYCPEDMNVPVNRSDVGYANVSWQKPHVVNNKNGTEFTLQVIPVWAKPPMPLRVSRKAHVITYVARHESGQEARCSINITVYNTSASIVKCTTCSTDKEGRETPGSGPQDAPSSSRVLLIVGTMVAVCVLLSVALSRAIYIRARHKSRHSLGPAVIESGKPAKPGDSIPLLITRSGSYVEAMGRSRELKTQPTQGAGTIDLYPIKEEHTVASQMAVPEIKEELIKSKAFDRSNSSVSNKSTVSEISRMMWNVSNLPENADPKLVAWGLIDHTGGKLEIGDTGVTLTVPQQAIPMGHTEGIYIALMKQDGEHPKLTPKESILSPVVMCGPSGIKFNRPVILSVPHCALLQDGAWNLKVQCNENEPTSPAEWKQLIDVNKQDGTESSFVVMEPKMYHLMVDHFTDYVLTGESASEKPAVRMVQIVAYVTPPEVNKDCVVRVYCVADTPAALESVHNQEVEKFGGETIDAPKPLFFKDGGGNLIVNLLSNQEDWENKSGDLKKIRFLHIWNGIDRMPSCTFVFSTSRQGVTQFRGTFEVRQDCEDGDEQEVNVVVGVKKGSNDKSTPFTETTEQINTKLNCACTMSASLRKAASVASLEDVSAGSLTAGQVYSTRRSLLQLDTDGARAVPNPVSPAVSPIDLKHLSFSSGYSSNGCQSLLSVHSMPQELRNDLVFALDPPHDADWKLLAEILGFESKHIRWLESRKDSPTETLLNWWEMKRSRKFPLRRLAEILREIGRDDAASLIEAQLPRETVV